MPPLPSSEVCRLIRATVITTINAFTISIAASSAGDLAGIYPLLSLWQGADFVTRSSMILLLAMFLVSVYVILNRFFCYLVHARHARTVAAGFWTAPNLYEALKLLEPESAFRRIAQAGLEAATHPDGCLTDRIGTAEWIALSIDRAVRELRDSLQERLGVLGIIAPAAVAVGFIGAIWSLNGALTGFADHSGLEDLASPIGEALLITGLGLVVALPAMAGYNWLIQRNAQLTDKAREFAFEIQALLLSADSSAFEDRVDSRDAASASAVDVVHGASR